MMCVLFYIFLSVLFSTSAFDIHIVTNFDKQNEQQVEFSFRLFSSLLAFGGSPYYKTHFHACEMISPILKSNYSDINQDLISMEFQRLKVNVTKASAPRLSNSLLINTYSSNLYCALTVGKDLFKKQRYNDIIIFISSNFIVMSAKILQYATKPNHLKYPFFCLPNSGLSDENKGVCELDVFSLKVSLSLPLKYYLDSALRTRHSLDSALSLGVTKLSKLYKSIESPGIRFLNDILVTRGGKYWVSKSSTVDLIEFDGQHHVLQRKQDCTINIHIRDFIFNTLEPIQNTLTNFVSSINATSQFTGCQPFDYELQTSLKYPVLEKEDDTINFALELDSFNQFNSFNSLQSLNQTLLDSVSSIKLYDIIIYFDELSLLRTRIELYKDYVEKFLIIEWAYTFTGKRKPFYLTENRYFLSNYLDKIALYIIYEFPIKAPISVSQIIKNYYESWGAGQDMLLQQLNASRDDVFMISEVTEILDPTILSDMKDIFQFSAYRRMLTPADNRSLEDDLLGRFYKFQLRHYMYDFHCHISNRIAKGQSAVTMITLQESKRLPSKNTDNILIKARDYYSQSSTIPLEYFISQAGWMLSYFSNLERTKNKIEASHLPHEFYFLYESNPITLQTNDDYLYYLQGDYIPGTISIDKLYDHLESRYLLDLKERVIYNRTCQIKPFDFPTKSFYQIWRKYRKSEDYF